MLEALACLVGHWIDTKGVLLFLLVLLVTKYIRDLPSKNYPPGPFPLPFVGNMLNISIKDRIGSFKKFVETYGDVTTLDLGGGNRCVLLSGLRGFKEAFVEQSDTFTDRPSYPLNDRLSRGLGLISSNGHMWRQQRRFALSTLKYFGVGKKTLETAILQESHFLCESYLAERGLPFNPEVVTNNAVANIVCTLVFGHRFKYNDHHFHHMLKCSEDVFQLPATFWGSMYNQFPTLLHYLPGRHQSAFINLGTIKQFIREEVEEHKEDRNPSNPRDYIDCYLEEIEKNQDGAAGFTEENLLYCVVDLFGAGTETTSKSLRWAMLYMAKYPDIQEKVQVEIDEVIGSARQPSMDDRAEMPYTYAVIHEIQRFGNIVPFTPPRVASKDTTVAGYLVPKVRGCVQGSSWPGWSCFCSSPVCSRGSPSHLHRAGSLAWRARWASSVDQSPSKSVPCLDKTPWVTLYCILLIPCVLSPCLLLKIHWRRRSEGGNLRSFAPMCLEKETRM
ncbi:cytochrome P450 2J4-like isoform X2 [Coregonus clupeaformis]|uniref:cytochrome P450 2J4-like isoform X2 n=1 Tax=Coregonus clupeaformis TaxID=59861 RepID=UPI001BE09475|nr:cytochrome P450 2J4-like isoform X2 [Coregonus clupeaformis]